METLHDLAVKHKTDKGETHLYMPNYEKYIGSWRDKEFTLLEVGYAGGCSFRMWKEAFPKAKIYSIDINPDCAIPGEVFIGSQTDIAFLDSVLAEIGPLDVCISDGSHRGDDEVITFKHMFPRLKEGGLMFIEDTHTFYNEDPYSGPFESNGRTRAYNFFTDLVAHVDVCGRAMTGNTSYAIEHGMTDPPVPEYSRILDSIHIHPSLWLFKRK